MRNIGALILAAGGSARFGYPKQFLTFDGETLVRRVTNAAIDAGCERLVVVAGDAVDRIRQELDGLPATIVQNAGWLRGPGSSIKCGLAALLRDDPQLSGVLILACDQPFVSADTIRKLAAQPNAIVASGYEGTVGVPALFRRKYFAALSALPETSGAKELIEANRADVAVVPFPPGAIDIDTRADYDALNRRSD
jgi:molybdenum cofactor cytidylyltransferase